MVNRWLSEVKITDMKTLTDAIAALHTKYRVPHIIITSVKLPAPASTLSLSVIGSTMTSTARPRIFKIEVPAIDSYFSGTGDMFAALIVVRLREAVSAVPGLAETDAWVSEDNVNATDLPLALAAERALASIQEVLIRTKRNRDEELERYQQGANARNPGLQEGDKESHLRITKASEVRLVRNMEQLRNPRLKFHAEIVDFEST
jgi:pyridoxine kinase